MTDTQASCCEPPAHLESAIPFAANMRPHISVNMPDIQSVKGFYVALMGEAPVKEVEDYIKWEPADPPVNFTLNKHPAELASSEDLGIEVASAEQAGDIAGRLREIGVDVEENGSSYFAADSFGNRWEIMVRDAG